ncbi:MAG: TIGR00730 family Rossman fold protein [Proteobacteria bacterium]|nr:TIGR00730 family Rossman fold protein [Pseudomonadota bacterium]MBU0965882.1 TIGR00730 family Rossman fold protein [Pseudomonadota bacterium]
MPQSKQPFKRFPSAQEDAHASSIYTPPCPQTDSPSYRLSYTDSDFIMRDELRPVRLQLELMKPELLQQEHGIKATVVVFGGSRVPQEETAQQRLKEAEKMAENDPANEIFRKRVASARRVLAKSHYYEEARKLGKIISETCHARTGCKLVVITGGGPGIMEAANRGASDADAKTIGLNIVLPHEQAPNPYITPELSFQFHYFSIRKMHFLMRAQALVAFPGGFGTLDELFETLTLIQTKKIKPLPVLLFGRQFWEKLINFDFLVEEGVIAPEDLDIFQFVDTAEEAGRIIFDSFNADDKY